MIKKLKWLYLLLIVATMVGIAYVVLRPSSGVELPKQLGGLQQVHLVEGEKANEILDRMHDKEVTPASNKIGMYSGAKGSAVVYLSIYRSDDDATAAYKKMSRSIEKGNLLFGDYRAIKLKGIDASFCVGQGQSHYFFVDDERLYWLAADAAIAEGVAQELVGEL